MKISTNTLKGLARKLVQDESGQSTTEYVLLLVFVVIAVKKVGSQLQTGLSGLISTAMGKASTAVETTETN